MGWLSKIPFVKNFLKPSPRLINRELRIGLRHADVYFRPQHADLSGIINVVNISCGGLALDKEFSPAWPEEGEVIPGRLFMRDSSFDICCRVIHKAGDVIGCELVEKPEDFTTKLNDFLKVELSAHNLVQIQEEILKEQAQGIAHYYHNKDQNELYYVYNKGKIEYFSLVIFGRFLSLGEGQTLRSGTVIKEVSEKVHGYKRIDPVSWSNSVDKDFVLQAIRFVDNVDQIPGEHRRVLTSLIKSKLE